MWRNKQYDAEMDGNISLQTANTLQRRAANDASMYLIYRVCMHVMVCIQICVFHGNEMYNTWNVY